ncbi:MAG: uncharacterized protein A8A55_1155 [Amphiamblys sp. WSBS2006]|nr:MAG: uncharacterized protein A8A55_1155 [Amphiamblys sp. WSBS2006]
MAMMLAVVLGSFVVAGLNAFGGNMGKCGGSPYPAFGRQQCTCNKFLLGLVSKGKRFNSRWTAEDIKNVQDCSQWSAAMVNKISSPEAARGLTAQCLAKFNVAGIERKYLEHIAPSEIKQLDDKTIGEILTGSIENIPAEEEWIRTIIEKISWEEIGPEFSQKVISRPDILESIIDTFAEDPKRITKLFSKKVLSRVPGEVCKLMTREMIEGLEDHVFKKISPECFGHIPDSAFAGFSAKQFLNINPKALQHMTAAQGNQLNEDIVVDITQKMAENWGRETRGIMKPESENKEDYNAQQTLLKEYLATHPCMALKGIKKEKIKSTSARTVLGERCKAVWENPLNKSSGTAARAALCSTALTALSFVLCMV